MDHEVFLERPVSAVAAKAASLSESVETSAAGYPRRRLRSVPASGPSGDGGLDDPLRLGRAMRLRLRDAVQALLADPSVAGQGDTARLAAVVLYAKSRAPQGQKSDNQTSIWVAELGRWLGVGESAVHRYALAPLRKSDALHTKVVTDAQGQPTGLDCLVMPLWRARKNGGAGHPLALSKADLATLLRLIEALFGPGWAPKGKEPIPPGKLAGRTGRGAATDRLGLLLMVLNTRESGWLQLCGGSVNKREGRGAATLARLMGCSPSGARKILARLAEDGVVALPRKATSTRMHGRGRIMLLPVARAYGRCTASVEAVSGSGPVFSARPDSAGGDHAPVGAAGPFGTSGIEGADALGNAVIPERPDSAELHADHASVVTAGGSLSLSGGFSGEGREGNPGLPGRACVREEGPLRGEQLKECPIVEGVEGGRGPVVGGSVRVVDGRGESRQQRGRPLPPEDLRAVLAPVDLVWARLERPAARRLVEAAVRGELKTVEGFTGRADAPQVLADRLARRLADQMRLAGPIQDPVGWLLARGLPQRQWCAELRCDEGVLLDSGRECPRCEDRQVDRRARRSAVAAAVDAAMPHATEAERRAEVDRQVHKRVTAQAWAREREREQVRARKAAAKARAAAAAERVTAPAEPVVPVVVPAPRPAAAPVLALADVAQEQELVLEDLTREQVIDWRARAAHDHQIVFDHIDQFGETSARRLFSHQLVNEAQRLAGTHHLVLEHTTWGQA
jgi:hypothetical protein